MTDLTRRDTLAAGGAVTAGLLAGCLFGSDPFEDVTADDLLLDPGDDWEYMGPASDGTAIDDSPLSGMSSAIYMRGMDFVVSGVYDHDSEGTAAEHFDNVVDGDDLGYGDESGVGSEAVFGSDPDIAIRLIRVDHVLGAIVTGTVVADPDGLADQMLAMKDEQWADLR